jgi:hypothetical protein
LGQARERLAGAAGGGHRRFVAIYEAMLRTNGWTDAGARTAEVDRVRRHVSRIPFGTREQVLTVLERGGADGLTAREIVDRCQPVAPARVAVVLAGLSQDGRIEAVGPGPHSGARREERLSPR